MRHCVCHSFNLHERKRMMEAQKILLLLLLCLNLVSSLVIAGAPPTCAANLDSKCADSDEWKGEFFPGIPKIKYEGPSSKNHLAFKWYNPEEVILGKKMKDWMRFSVAFWHTFRGTGSDPFGVPTKSWPWEDGTNSMAMAKRRMRANFEFIDKLGVDFWCFHDRDIAPDGETLKEANANLDEVVALAKELQGTKVRPLWGTAQLFSHPRYMHGAATSSEVAVYAYAAAQVKKAMEVTHYLGGENYVFWGGREGYQSLLNTDMGREIDHMANFFESAAAYKKKIGFKDDFKLNIECNHATLSGHSCHHDIETARLNGLLGNIDANTGDPQVGWDTDQFLTDIGEATLIMLSVIKNGGLAPGGFNFDAKLRRESTDVEDLFIAHIVGMDTVARGLRTAAKLIEDGSLPELVRKRYQSFDSEIGQKIEAGKADFEMLEKKAMEWGEPKVPSAKQVIHNFLSSNYPASHYVVVIANAMGPQPSQDLVPGSSLM
ncbi:Xylose isomerase [Citrus sinensis]|uniref:Xylose isomerase n=1 Tax=Citrus sinensis TaxID=2711 RepID=A0ACB8P878_CITSI|nr:Xylose isomerase [Citrus sinensis]